MADKSSIKNAHLYVLALGMSFSLLAAWQTHINDAGDTQEAFDRAVHKTYAHLEKSFDWKMAELREHDQVSNATSFEDAIQYLDVPALTEEVVAEGGLATVAVEVATGDTQDKKIIYKDKNKSEIDSQYFDTLPLVVQNRELFFSFYPTDYFFKIHQEKYPYILFCVLSLLSIMSSYYVWRLNRQMIALDGARMRAQEASRLKNEFLATMSHEIRSPMSGVLGMAELLMQTEQTSEQRGYTKTIIDSGETLLNIIEDILDFSKIEANKIELDPIAVNMLQIVDDVCALYAPKAREKALEVAVRYVPGSEQFVYADPVRVRQILSNLVNNAIKFTKKGYVIITVREDKSFNAAGLVNLIFTVEDTGVGIPEGSQERIFEKFMQADSSTTRDFGGTGLGLSICSRLIEMMGGNISIQSAAGEGCTFTFNLPLTRNRNEIYAPLRPPVLKDVKALIVDDLDVIRTLLTEQLTLAGMRCTAVATGEEALETMQQAASIYDPYKMIVIDYLLPGMNGEMLARAINDEPEFDNTCLVMLTAAGNPGAIESFARKGFSACISKPVTVKALIETLAAVWSRYREGQTDVMIPLDELNPAHETEPHEPKLLGKRVLVAEDSRINQAFVEDVLEQLACTVAVAANGREAIDAVQTGHFDLVLMDCQMPVMDGFEATQKICELKKMGSVRGDLPIIALTANAMKGDRQKCLEAGMNDYLSKPVRSRDLKEKVYYWITRNEKAATMKKETKIIPFSKPADADLLDQAAIEESRGILKDKYPTMLAYYKEDTANYLDEIKTALETGILNGAMRPAHTIKSTSHRMGAPKLSELAKVMEVGIRDGTMDAAALKKNLADMTIVFEQTCAALFQEKKGRAN